jgi:hypothetical protein
MSRRRRLATTPTFAAALLLAAACSGEEVVPEGVPAERPLVADTAETKPSPAGAPSSTAPTDSVVTARPLIRYESRRAAYIVDYPSDWYRAHKRLTPHLLDPLEVLAVATYPLRSGGDRCAHQPVNALEDLGPSDAFIALYERADPELARYPKRPGRLSGLLEGIADSGRFCVPDSDRLDTWVPFSDGDRAFYLLVAVGRAAAAETRSQVEAILDSFRIIRGHV